MERKDIVELVRARPSFVDRDEEALQKLGLLGYELVDTLETRLGKWDFYTRENYVLPYFLEPDEEHKEPSSDFVAIYYRNDKPVNLFSGKLEYIELAKKDAEIFSKNILEQPVPLRWFSGNDGILPTALIGFLIGGGVAGYKVFQFLHLPQGYLIPAETILLNAAILPISLIASFVAGFPLMSLADKLRMRNVSQPAKEGYDYSWYTLDNLKGELCELEKEKVYRRFLEEGLSMTRDGFMWLYERRGADKDRLFDMYQEWVERVESIERLKEIINPETIDRIVGIFEEFREN